MKEFRNIMNQRKNDPITTFKKFIGTFYANSFGEDERKEIMRQVLNYNSSTLKNDLEAAKMILENSSFNQELVEIILWDANYPLEEPLVEQAKSWLKKEIIFTQNVINEFESNSPNK